jgi:hypothetical protein
VQEAPVDGGIVFANFLTPGKQADERRYERVAKPEKLPKLLGTYLDELNVQSATPMNLGRRKHRGEDLARRALIHGMSMR